MGSANKWWIITKDRDKWGIMIQNVYVGITVHKWVKLGINLDQCRMFCGDNQ